MLTARGSQAMLAGGLICLVALAGGIAYFLPHTSLRRAIPLGASLSVGVLLGDAFLHLLPEALQRLGDVELVMQWTLGGILLFFGLEKAVRWSHVNTHLDALTMAAKPMAPMNLMGDGIHNFIDGTLIGGAFLVSPEAGWATTLGIVVHELPQEIGDIGTLVWGGYSLRRAIWYNLLCATTSLLGVGLILWTGLWLEAYTAYALPLAAGGFIYIAGSDLIPELHRQTARSASFWQSLFIALGVGIMMGLQFLE